jgi:Skp family chaperone for outer membrane proteins
VSSVAAATPSSAPRHPSPPSTSAVGATQKTAINDYDRLKSEIDDELQRINALQTEKGQQQQRLSQTLEAFKNAEKAFEDDRKLLQCCPAAEQEVIPYLDKARKETRALQEQYEAFTQCVLIITNLRDCLEAKRSCIELLQGEFDEEGLKQEVQNTFNQLGPKIQTLQQNLEEYQ